jgi:hypothetical protein
MEEYERLYTEFLMRSIKAEKDKTEMEHKLARLNWITLTASSIKCA